MLVVFVGGNTAKKQLLIFICTLYRFLGESPYLQPSQDKKKSFLIGPVISDSSSLVPFDLCSTLELEFPLYLIKTEFLGGICGNAIEGDCPIAGENGLLIARGD